MFAVLGTVVALTSRNGVATVTLWQAVLFPALLFALPALVGAVVTEWREAGGGAIARLRDRVEAAAAGWAETPGLIVRGTAVVVVGLVGLGALLTAVGLVLKGGEIIALYEAAHLDVLGATVVTLAQLAYLPTLVVWGLAFVAGPGFAVGAGTAVSPAGTQVGVVPGIPLLGIVPESTTPWLLLLVLGPIALGALAGWIARSRLTRAGAPTTPAPSAAVAAQVPGDGAQDFGRTAALAGMLAESTAARAPEPEPSTQPSPVEPADPIGARLVITLGIAVAVSGGRGTSGGRGVGLARTRPARDDGPHPGSGGARRRPRGHPRRRHPAAVSSRPLAGSSTRLHPFRRAGGGA